MKAILFSIFLSTSFILLSNSSLFAQKIDCKTEKDPITGTKIYTAVPAKSIGFKLEQKEGESIKCHWPINYLGQQHVVFKEGAQFIFKLENDKIVTLKTINAPKPQTLVGAYQVVTKYAFVLEVSKEQLAQLASSPIVFSRTPTPTGEQRDDEDIWESKKLQKIYLKTFQCMNEQLN